MKEWSTREKLGHFQHKLNHLVISHEYYIKYLLTGYEGNSKFIVPQYSDMSQPAQAIVTVEGNNKLAIF